MTERCRSRSEFKSLMLNMLNPDVGKRFAIDQVADHPWIAAGQLYGEYPPVDDDWKMEICTKHFEKENLQSPEEMSEALSAHQFGKLGGIYNIELHLQRTKDGIKSLALPRKPKKPKKKNPEAMVINQVPTRT